MLGIFLLAASLCSFADPFVGTAGTGHTTPAAAYPFGMVQAGPDTGNGQWAYCSGYLYKDKTILGYSQNHLSGTGCADLGDVRILPFVGDFGSGVRAIDKSSERAMPGYYAVRQPDDGLLVEIAATKRAAIYRVTSERGGEVSVMVDPDSFLYAWNNSTNEWRQTRSRRTESGITGDLVRNIWVKGRRMSFALEFDRPWKSVERRGERHFAAFDLKRGESLHVKIGLSPTSSARAAANLADSIPDWDFEDVLRKTAAKWEELFSRTVIEGPDELRRNFYTALYHLYYQPHDYSNAGERPFYTTLSLWDTFRAAQPWYALVVPEIVPDICRSLMRIHREIGRLPVMSYGGRNVDCMIANHGVPVLVDAYLKGLDIGDPEEAYVAIRNTLLSSHADKPKEDWDVYDKYGYFPYDVIKGESVSRTLECAYDDHCAAQMAEKLGHREDAEKFRRRSQNWKNVFDPSSGFVRGRDSCGRWREPFDPFKFGGGANWSCYDCTEGNAWQYTWHVMQDPQGLVAAMGGQERFLEKLDGVFHQQSGESGIADATGCIGQYVHGNEPSHHVAYFYALVGCPEKTEKVVREVFARFYRPRPDGLCGNDDCGQMSAWFVFSALGFYPFDPCNGGYVLGVSQVSGATIRLAGGRTLEVRVKGMNEKADGESRRRTGGGHWTLNGKPIEGPTLRHGDILAGGVLDFLPNHNWKPKRKENN